MANNIFNHHGRTTIPSIAELYNYADTEMRYVYWPTSHTPNGGKLDDTFKAMFPTMKDMIDNLDLDIARSLNLKFDPEKGHNTTYVEYILCILAKMFGYTREQVEAAYPASTAYWDIAVPVFTITTCEESESVTNKIRANSDTNHSCTADATRQAIAEAESNTIPTNSQQVAIPVTPVTTAAEPAETKPSDNNKKKEAVNTENVFKNIEGVTINELNYGGSTPNVRKLKLTTDKGEFIVLADEAGEIISDTPKFIVITGENDGTPLLAIELKENSIKKWLSDPTSYRGCISKEIFNLYTKKLCDFSKGSPARKWQVQKFLAGFMKNAGQKIVAAFGKIKCDLIDKDRLTISVDANSDKICDVELSKDDKKNKIRMYPNYAQFFEASHQHDSNNCSCGCNDSQQSAAQPAASQTPQMLPMNNMVSPEMLFQMMSNPEFMQAMVTAGQQIAAQAAG